MLKKAALANGQETADAPSVRTEQGLTDDDWVKVHCSKMLERIQNPEAFKRSAILFRKTLEARAAFAAKPRKVVMQSHAEAPSPFSWHLLAFLVVEHPSEWKLCGECLGLNKEDPGCKKCKGAGFLIGFTWPKKPAKTKK
jgi:hypothetical protein